MSAKQNFVHLEPVRFYTPPRPSGRRSAVLRQVFVFLRGEETFTSEQFDRVCRLQLMEQQVDSDDGGTTTRPVVSWRQLLPPDNHPLFHCHSHHAPFYSKPAYKTDLICCCGVLVSPLSLPVFRTNNSKLCYFLLNTEAGGRSPVGKYLSALSLPKLSHMIAPPSRSSSLHLLLSFLSFTACVAEHQLPFYPPPPLFFKQVKCHQINQRKMADVFYQHNRGACHLVSDDKMEQNARVQAVTSGGGQGGGVSG